MRSKRLPFWGAENEFFFHVGTQFFIDFFGHIKTLQSNVGVLRIHIRDLENDIQKKSLETPKWHPERSSKTTPKLVQKCIQKSIEKHSQKRN